MSHVHNVLEIHTIISSYLIVLSYVNIYTHTHTIMYLHYPLQVSSMQYYGYNILDGDHATMSSPIRSTSPAGLEQFSTTAQPTYFNENEMTKLKTWFTKHHDRHGNYSPIAGESSPGLYDSGLMGEMYGLGTNFSFHDYLKIIQENRAQSHWFSTSIEVPLVCVYVLIILFGLLGNGCVCYVIIRKRTLRTSRNMFIMNLAVSDMIMCLLCMPFTLMKLLLKNWPLGDAMCRLVPWLQAVNVFASTITIVAIALDRYHVIIYPSSLKVCRIQFNEPHSIPRCFPQRR